MAKKKLSTTEILAAARAQTQGDGANDDAPPPEEAATPSEAVPVQSPKPAATGAPKSTADILAAARAGKTGAANPAAKPTSTADILAAARTGKSGGAKASPAVSGKPTTKETPTSTAGDHPSVQEMLQAVRSGKQTSETGTQKAAAITPAKPVRPSRPVPPIKGTKKKTDAGRRSLVAALLLSPFALAWMMMGGVLTAWGLGLARFMMPNVLVEPPSKFKIGPVSDYPSGTVSTKWKAKFGVWVVNTEWEGKGELVALSTVCTHLGCTPNWLESEQKFKCPCHGSGFYVTGVNFEGPAPRPLERHGIRIASDGMIEVDKSVKFQEELGQWSNNKSYVEMT
ncbi:Ubiquinol-cytochrome C reductase iron-sulfur subunit [hydrothermal vent metagenome]|uniref:Ubiquinol-cytochrome C reductase iron-sulfur subunit n=1 Tax=hydrothermal vent metagenome TaxID=652676 RepID=A0A3B1DUR5_9ZZZZ